MLYFYSCVIFNILFYRSMFSISGIEFVNRLYLHEQFRILEHCYYHHDVRSELKQRRVFVEIRKKATKAKAVHTH